MSRKPIAAESVRTGLGADAIAAALIENLHCLQGKPPQHATRNDWLCTTQTRNYFNPAANTADDPLHRV